MEKTPDKTLIHALKIWPMDFQAIVDRLMCHDFRLNDRDFRIYDVLDFHEWDPKTEQFTGRVIRSHVTYMTPNGEHGVPEGYCVLSLADPNPMSKATPEESMRLYEEINLTKSVTRMAAVRIEPAQMDAPGGPRCACGKPSVYQNGSCNVCHEQYLEAEWG